MSIKLLLDSADPQTWKKYFQTGIFNGITTNPTLLKQANQSCSLANLKDLTKFAKKLGCKELHLQSWGQRIDQIINCGIEIGSFSSEQMKVYVKIPLTIEGVGAAKQLINNNISVTLTACYEAKQILIAEAIGASYIAPYLGRMNDQGIDAPTELVTMQKILKRTSSNCKILVASIRATKEIIHLASHGIKTFTINSNLAEDLLTSNASLEASKLFEENVKSHE